MTEYDRTNRGSIWRNEKKDIKDVYDTKPDFTGTLNVEGREFYVSAWKRKEGANPKSPALSMSIKPKEEHQSISERATPKAPNNYAAATGRRDPISTGPLDRDLDDVVPF